MHILLASVSLSLFQNKEQNVTAKSKVVKGPAFSPLNQRLDFRLTVVGQHNFENIVSKGYGHIENTLTLSEKKPKNILLLDSQTPLNSGCPFKLIILIFHAAA